MCVDDCSAGEDNCRDVAGARIKGAVHSENGTFAAFGVTAAWMMKAGELLVGPTVDCLLKISLSVIYSFHFVSQYNKSSFKYAIFL